MKIWWKAWGELILRLVTITGSLASLVGFLIAFWPSTEHLPWWATTLIVVATILFLLFLFLEVHSHGGRRVYATSDETAIKRYMHNWIQHGGRVAIWSRDMTWAHKADTQKLLLEKAACGELILCLPELNDFANKLAAAGAEVCTYGSMHLESPASRFTISFFGRDGAQVAVGRAQGDTHVIEEFKSGSHPAFYLAEDLIALVRAQCRKRQDQ